MALRKNVILRSPRSRFAEAPVRPSRRRFAPPEEPATRASRRTHGVDPASRLGGPSARRFCRRLRLGALCGGAARRLRRAVAGGGCDLADRGLLGGASGFALGALRFE